MDAIKYVLERAIENMVEKFVSNYEHQTYNKLRRWFIGIVMAVTAIIYFGQVGITSFMTFFNGCEVVEFSLTALVVKLLGGLVFCAVVDFVINLVEAILEYRD